MKYTDKFSEEVNEEYVEEVTVDGDYCSPSNYNEDESFNID